MSFTAVIYASSEDSFLSLKSKLIQHGVGSIAWCNSKVYSRSEFISQNENQWLLFLDHDCEVSSENLQLIEGLTASAPHSSSVFAGIYADCDSSSYIQKVHNFIANTWLLQSYEMQQNKLVLGGIFLVFAKDKLNVTEEKLFWGAEDKVLTYQFAQSGFAIKLLTDLKVKHLTSNSVKHFIRRAYLHGKNDIKYVLKDNNKISYLFWIRRIGFVNLNLLPLIVFHFCIQRSAELIQIIRR